MVLIQRGKVIGLILVIEAGILSMAFLQAWKCMDVKVPSLV